MLEIYHCCVLVEEKKKKHAYRLCKRISTNFFCSLSIIQLMHLSQAPRVKPTPVGCIQHAFLFVRQHQNARKIWDGEYHEMEDDPGWKLPDFSHPCSHTLQHMHMLQPRFWGPLILPPLPACSHNKSGSCNFCPVWQHLKSKQAHPASGPADDLACWSFSHAMHVLVDWLRASGAASDDSPDGVQQLYWPTTVSYLKVFRANLETMLISCKNNITPKSQIFLKQEPVIKCLSKCHKRPISNCPETDSPYTIRVLYISV